MFLDKFFDITDTDFLFGSVINTNVYVSIDPAYLSNVNLFVRR
jgi:hypothetical protein